MKGKLTQVDIKEQLGTLSVHLEIDVRTLRYLGHLVRLPEDRWEHRFLLGLLLEEEHVPSRQMGQDLWWSRVRRLVLEIMKFAPKEDLWVNLANDKKVWRKMLAEWKKHRISLERQDTQKSRQNKWEEASKRCLNKEFVSHVFQGSKPISSDGTSVQHIPVQLLQHAVIARGIVPNAWASHAPKGWKLLFQQEDAMSWLENKGQLVKRRPQKWTVQDIQKFDVVSSAPMFDSLSRRSFKSNRHPIFSHPRPR